MDDYQKEWEQYDTRRKVLVALMVLEFLIPFRLLGEPVSNYLLGGRYAFAAGGVVWMSLAALTMFTVGLFPCPRCGKRLVVSKEQIQCAACGLTKQSS